MSYCPRLQRSARGGGGRRGSGGITCLIALGYKDLRAGAEAGGVGGGVACLIALYRLQRSARGGGGRRGSGGGVACLIALGYKDPELTIHCEILDGDGKQI